MRATILLAAAAVAGTVALSGSASAQVGVYVGPGPGYDGYYYYGEPAYPRVYRYSPNYYNEDDDDGVVFGYAPVLPYPRGGCGTYNYWDGFRCVDARRKKSY